MRGEIILKRKYSPFLNAYRSFMEKPPEYLAVDGSHLERLQAGERETILGKVLHLYKRIHRRADGGTQTEPVLLEISWMSGGRITTPVTRKSMKNYDVLGPEGTGEAPPIAEFTGFYPSEKIPERANPV